MVQNKKHNAAIHTLGKQQLFTSFYLSSSDIQLIILISLSIKLAWSIEGTLKSTII